MRGFGEKKRQCRVEVVHQIIRIGREIVVSVSEGNVLKKKGEIQETGVHGVVEFGDARQRKSWNGNRLGSDLGISGLLNMDFMHLWVRTSPRTWLSWVAEVGWWRMSWKMRKVRNWELLGMLMFPR